ncbi:MAG: serine hydrolase domain-containing protein [Pirellulales bacterium]
MQFDPGEKSAYSNFGYCLLGRVVERSTGKCYFDALDERILKPAGIVDVRLGYAALKQRDPREPDYAPGEDDFDLDVMDAHGGLIASAPAVCEMFACYWIDGTPRKAGERQNWAFMGSLPGTTALIRQDVGWDVCLLFNGRRDKTLEEDARRLLKSVDQALKDTR